MKEYRSKIHITEAVNTSNLNVDYSDLDLDEYDEKDLQSKSKDEIKDISKVASSLKETFKVVTESKESISIKEISGNINLDPYEEVDQENFSISVLFSNGDEMDYSGKNGAKTMKINGEKVDSEPYVNDPQDLFDAYSEWREEKLNEQVSELM